MARKARIALNGFGRIGRHMFRMLFEENWCQIVGVRVLHELNLRDRLYELKNDPYYGTWEYGSSVEVNSHETEFIYNETGIPFFQTGDNRWAELIPDIIIDCSGEKSFSIIKSMAQYAKRIVVTHPVREAPILIFGVNHQSYNSSMTIVSAGSCTTNCAAPILYAFMREKRFKLLECSGVTVHSGTKSQTLLGALEQIVDYTTGASTAIEAVFPELCGKTMFSSFRVPTAQVSCLTLFCRFDTVPEPADIHYLLDRAGKSYSSGVLNVVSVPKKKDRSGSYRKKPYSAIVNAESIARAPNGSMVEVHAWYDNEYGYSSRVKDIAEYIAHTEKFFTHDIKQEFISEYVPRSQDYDDLYLFPENENVPRAE